MNDGVFRRKRRTWHDGTVADHVGARLCSHLALATGLRVLGAVCGHRPDALRLAQQGHVGAARESDDDCEYGRTGREQKPHARDVVHISGHPPACMEAKRSARPEGPAPTFWQAAADSSAVSAAPAA